MNISRDRDSWEQRKLCLFRRMKEEMEEERKANEIFIQITKKINRIKSFFLQNFKIAQI